MFDAGRTAPLEIRGLAQIAAGALRPVVVAKVTAHALTLASGEVALRSELVVQVTHEFLTVAAHLAHMVASIHVRSHAIQIFAVVAVATHPAASRGHLRLVVGGFRSEMFCLLC